MFITCNQSDLIKTLNIVIRAVPSRSTIDILSCVVIKTIGDTINLVANDIDFGIESVLSGTVNEGGSIALGAKIFTDIVRKLPNDTVTIKTDDTLRATITCGKSVFKIAGRGTDDYPDLPEVKKDKKITISQFSLKDVINKTIFAASTNETVKILTGEYFEVSDNRLRVTALDNHRIAVHSIDLVDNNDNVKAIIPAKTLNEVSRIISGEVSENIAAESRKQGQPFQNAVHAGLIDQHEMEGEENNIDDPHHGGHGIDRCPMLRIEHGNGTDHDDGGEPGRDQPVLIGPETVHEIQHKHHGISDAVGRMNIHRPEAVIEFPDSQESDQDTKRSQPPAAQIHEQDQRHHGEARNNSGFHIDSLPSLFCSHALTSSPRSDRRSAGLFPDTPPAGRGKFPA